MSTKEGCERKRKRRWKSASDIDRGLRNFMERRVEERQRGTIAAEIEKPLSPIQASNRHNQTPSDGSGSENALNHDCGQEVYNHDHNGQVEASENVVPLPLGEPTSGINAGDTFQEIEQDIETNVEDQDDVFIVPIPLEADCELPELPKDPTVASKKSVRLIRPGNLTALSLLLGTGRMSVRHFISARRFINYENDRYQVPSYYTVLYCLYPILESEAFVSQITKSVEVNVLAAGVPTRFRQMQKDGCTPKETISIVLPSRWCRRDAKEMLQWESSLKSDTEHMGYPETAFIGHSAIASSKSALCGLTVLSECSRVGGAYHSGRYIYVGDTIELECRRLSKQLAALLTSCVGIRVDRRCATFKAVISDIKLCEEGEISKGLGDVSVTLQLLTSVRDAVSLGISLLYHLDSPPGHLSSSVAFNSGNFNEGGIRWTQLKLCNRVSGKNRVPAVGVLGDGRRYLVVPYLLFSDDFSTMTGRHGSSGGTYMLPLTVPPWARKGSQSVRVISLTPPGVSSNVVLRNIVEDIVDCATKGILSKTGSGEEVVVFMDLIGYTGDYPGIVHAVDVLGKNANTPCPLCVFRRSDIDKDGTNSQYAYSSSIHSGDLCFRRTQQRMDVIRKAATSDCTLRHFGLKEIDEGERKMLPLHMLSDAMREARTSVAKTSEGHPVIDLAFDPYLSCIVAPSHVLYGLTQNVVEAMLRVCTPSQRREVDELIYTSLHSNGCTTEHSLFNPDKIKMNSMSISNTRAVLIVAPWAFRSVLQVDLPTSVSRPGSIMNSILFVLYKFRSLATETDYLPQKYVDGVQEVLKLQGEQGEKRISTLKLYAAQYLKVLDYLCGQSEQMRKFLDKPNVHRLVELYQHSLPRLGHTALFDELIFEATHQPLKRALSRSNYQKGHMFALRSVISNEWRACLGAAAHEILGDTELLDEDCMRLLLAAFGDDSLIQDGLITLNEIREAFIPPVLEEFRAYTSLTQAGRKMKTVWAVVKKSAYPKVAITSSTQNHNTKSRAALSFKLNCGDGDVRKFLLQLIPNTNGSAASDCIVREYRAASRTSFLVRGVSDDAAHLTPSFGSRKKGYNTVTSGDSIQVLTPLHGETLQSFLRETGVRILPYTPGVGLVSHWLVLAIYALEDPAFIYAQCIPFQRETEGKIVQTRSMEEHFRLHLSSGSVLIHLTESCRKTMLLHCCTECDGCDCKGSISAARLLLSTPCIEWNKLVWSILGTRQGFPPRSS